jgi:hypothetical protein
VTEKVMKISEPTINIVIFGSVALRKQDTSQ